MADITNTSFDAKISSESATLTRVTDIDSDLPATNNSYIPIKCTTDNGYTLYISYDDLSVTANWTNQVARADGITGKLDAINTILGAQNTAIDAFTAPYSSAEWAATINALKVKNDMDALGGN